MFVVSEEGRFTGRLGDGLLLQLVVSVVVVVVAIQGRDHGDFTFWWNHTAKVRSAPFCRQIARSGLTASKTKGWTKNGIYG